MNNENNQNFNSQDVNNMQSVNNQGDQSNIGVENNNQGLENPSPVENQGNQNDKRGVGLLLCLIIGILISFVSPVGIVLVIISFVTSIIMMKQQVKFAKLVCILSIIHVLLYVIISVLLVGIVAATASKTIDNSRNDVFANIAITFASEVRTDILTSDNECNVNNGEIITYLSETDFYAPRVYQNEIDESSSYVKTVPIDKNGSCTYEYYVYMTDGEHSVGTSDNPVLMSEITRDSVQTK